MIIKNNKQIKNLSRIRSKKFLNILDLIELNIKKTHNLNFSFTILLNNDNTKEYSWNIELKNLFIKLNNFIKNELTMFSIYSVEPHRENYEINKDNNNFVVKTKKNSLSGYPHIHCFCCFQPMVDIDLDEDLIKNKYEQTILNEFIDYDIKINYISKKKHNIKNSIKYILKEYKFKDTQEILNNLNLNQFNSFINYYWVSLKNSLDKLSKLKKNKININLNYFTGPIIFDNTKDEFSLMNFLVHDYLKNYKLKFSNNIFYKKDPTSSNTWIKYCDTNNFYIKLLDCYQGYRTFISKNYKKYIDYYARTEITKSIDFCDFKYIEYNDFIFDLKNCKIINKPTEFLKCFKYFNIKLENLKKKTIFDLELSKLFTDMNEYIKYIKIFAYLLIKDAKKGKSLYLYGPSNSGKSLITERILTEIYSQENIAILNMSDKKYILDQINDKRFIILNEFQYKYNLRSLLLKLLDGTFIEINKKYESSTKTNVKAHTIALSNYSPKEINLDNAFDNRFIYFNINKKNININFNKILKEIPELIYLSIFLYFEKNNNNIKHLEKTKNEKIN